MHAVHKLEKEALLYLSSGVRGVKWDSASERAERTDRCALERTGKLTVTFNLRGNTLLSFASLSCSSGSSFHPIPLWPWTVPSIFLTVTHLSPRFFIETDSSMLQSQK